MAEKKNGEREQWADWIKGILALCVILSHTPGTPELYHVLDSFMLLPGFFIVSGYVTKIDPNHIGLFFGRRVLKLLILFVVWTMLIPFCELVNWKAMIVDHLSVFEVVKVGLNGLVFGHYFWFVSCLICVMILFGFLVWITKNNLIVISVISFVIFLVGFIFAREGEMFYWSADTALVGQAFFVAGYLLKQKKVFTNLRFLKNEGKLRCAFTWFYFAVLVLGTIFVGKIAIDMALNTYNNRIVTFLGFIAGNGMLILWARKIGTNRFITYIGRHSLIYFAIGSLETKRFVEAFAFLSEKTGSDLLVNPYFVNPMICLIYGAILLIPCLIIDKWLPFLNGGFHLFPDKTVVDK